MSGAPGGGPGLAAIASIEGELQEIDNLLSGIKQADVGVEGLLAEIADQEERDLLQLVLLLEIARSIGTLGGGTTIVQGGGQQPSGPVQVTGIQQLTDALQANVVVSELNVQAQANDDILSSDLEPADESSIYRLTFASDAGVVLSVSIDDGNDEFAETLNGGTALTANALYTFDITGINPDVTVNFQVDTQSTCEVLFVEEINAEAP